MEKDKGKDGGYEDTKVISIKDFPKDVQDVVHEILAKGAIRRAISKKYKEATP